jgi:hypothetical protein
MAKSPFHAKAHAALVCDGKSELIIRLSMVKQLQVGSRRHWPGDLVQLTPEITTRLFSTGVEQKATTRAIL